MKFKVRRIGHVRTEACAVADFNNDGRLDVIAGPNLYLAPEFRPVKVRDVTSNVNADGRGYADDFMNLPLDVNGDGRTDVISGGWFSKETCWAENALPSTNIWKRHLIDRTGNIETGLLVDIDGDGKATDLLPDTQHTCLYTPSGEGSFARDAVDGTRCNMGRGCGDLNGDGLNDVLTPTAWYEQLPGRKWRKHPLDIGFSDGGRALGHASNMIVYDVNGDGLADILVSSAHRYGIFWWEQLKERAPNDELRFRKHVIDDTWTQAHYLGWADINGDDTPELITGKRFRAHNGGDPDEEQAVEQALQKTGLTQKADYPARFLSGGEKRRLAVACMLAMDLSIIILDEPYANLDYGGVRQVNELVRSLKQDGKTVIILTHETEKCLGLADHFVVLFRGQKVFDGTPEQGLSQKLEQWNIRNPLVQYKNVGELVW